MQEQVQKVLDECTIEDNKVYLPNKQLDRQLYMAVDKKLKGIGGKWNRKERAHVFPSDPSELMGRVQNGEKINLKKDFQFFETPNDIADWLVEIASIEEWCTVLEPSAGQGAILDAMVRFGVDMSKVQCIELMEQNRAILFSKPYANPVLDYFDEPINDFLLYDGPKYDRIVANPPFSKNQDIDHVYQMYKCLNFDGRLVSVMSKHWEMSNNKKETEFRDWLQLRRAQIMDIDDGAFKASGTLVGAKIIIVDKYE